MKINNYIYASILTLLTFGSCSIPKIVSKDTNVTLPSDYTQNSKEAQDTVSVAKMNWKSFFKDQYLNQLIDSALVNNKELNILLQKINLAQNEIQVRKGEYLPFVNAGINADLEKVGEFTRNGAVEKNLAIDEDKKFPDPLGNLQLGLYASWELDVWHKLRNAQKVATMEYLSSIEGRNFVITNLVAEIANSYYELISYDNQLKNLESNIKIQKNALEVVQLLKQSAKTNSLAVKRFEAEVLKNQSHIYEVKQQIVEAENKINFLIGRTPQPIKRDSDNFMNLTPTIIQSGIPSQLLENRPDIRQAELELAASNLNIQVAKANFYPSFSIKAGLGYQAFNPEFLLKTPQSLLYSIAGDALAPLVNKNAIIAQYKNANAKQIQAAYEYEQTILNAYKEVQNQLSNIENLKSNFQLKEEQVKALTESVEISNLLFQSAKADYMEVLLTQRDVLEAKVDLIEIKKDQMSAVVNIYKALGGGWR
ncbi:MAG: efflux transporter outer membrane subunit [Flavobacteriales bacterium]|nr:efflux transporter outer membrane subunit [Flavobacteriales bacterium]